MNIPHPTRIVRFQLIAVLLGVSIPFAVENLVQEYSTSKLLAEVAFLLTALNFFHGKIVTLEDEDYNTALTDRPALALLDYGLNLVVALCFVFMAFFLDKPGKLISVNLIVRVLDIILVVVVGSVSPREAIHKAQKTWLRINVGAIAVFTLFLWIFWPVHEHHFATSLLFLLVILTDISVDYWSNRRLYFSMANSWDEMARFWDALQGYEGDIYRRNIILPAILEEAGLDPSKHVLDVGCGNGCISRVLARTGAKIVAIDNSTKHLEIARSYDTEGVSYLQVDLDDHAKVIAGSPFDVAILCFTLQDCATIETPLRLTAHNLKVGGSAIVIFENDKSFENLEEHSTGRRWVGPRRLAGKGRRQLILWEPQLISLLSSSPSADIEEMRAQWSCGFKTITRHWSLESYIQTALKCGLNLKKSPVESLPIRLENPDIKQRSLYLAKYCKRPRFGICVFEKQGQNLEGT